MKFIVCRFSVSKITENLFLCGACALRADTFEKLGITCVINCTTREELPDPPIADNITYLRIPVRDSTRTNLSQYFHTITDAIQNVRKMSNLIGCEKITFDINFIWYLCRQIYKMAEFWFIASLESADQHRSAWHIWSNTTICHWGKPTSTWKGEDHV